MTQDLIIVGAGGFGREVAWLATEATQPYRVVGFLDDAQDIPPFQLGGFPLLGTIDRWSEYANSQFIVAIGSPRVRVEVVRRMLATGQPVFASLIHKRASVGPRCSFGEGSIIAAGSILTTDISVGDHSIINIGCTIGHDVSMGNFNTLAPQVAVSGCVTTSAGVEVGTSASIRQGLTLASGAMLGMGSVLTKRIQTSDLCFGVPAKRIKTLPPFTPLTQKP
jgi:sugar O-acyltransferase (sialic acid O-acetyltransferase NeuD family)